MAATNLAQEAVSQNTLGQMHLILGCRHGLGFFQSQSRRFLNRFFCQFLTKQVFLSLNSPKWVVVYAVQTYPYVGYFIAFKADTGSTVYQRKIYAFPERQFLENTFHLNAFTFQTQGVRGDDDFKHNFIGLQAG